MMAKGRIQILIAALLSLGMAAGAQASSAARNGPGPGAQQKQMTNSDVIRMVHERRSESEIISEIKAAFQSGSAAFDVSPMALVELHKSGVSNNVLNAMMGDGSVKTGAGTLPGNTAPARGATGPGRSGGSSQPPPISARVLDRLSRTKLVAGPIIKLNGAHPSLDLNVMQALQQQSSQAHTEKLQLAAPAGKGAATPSPTAANIQTAQRPMLLAPGNSVGQIGAGKTIGATDSSGNPAGAAPNPAGGTTPGGSTPGSAGGTTPRAGGSTPPGTNGGSGSGNLASKLAMTHAPAPISACRFNNTTPIVETVSGRSPKNVYFTPDPGNDTSSPSNQYTIRGCNFGAAQGQGDVHLVGAFQNNPSPVRLGIDIWSDNLIVVTFNPTFQNEYDLDNVTLVVTNANGLSLQLPGNHFVARRASRTLTRIPNSLVKLPSTYLRDNKFASPVTSQNLQLAQIFMTPPPSASILFFIHTHLEDGYPPERLSFSDAIDFSKLRSGFAVDPNIQTFIGPYYDDYNTSVSCKFNDTVVSASMQGSSMLVGVQPEECDDWGKFIWAYYGLTISVIGPVGEKLDPWQAGLN